MLAVASVQDSFARCNLNSNFIDTFYNIFLASNPVFAEMFANTDFSAQKDLLRRGISMMILFAEGNVVGKLALDRLGKTHGIHGMNIPADLYNFWMDSLVSAVAKIDPEFGPALEEAWREVLNKGVRHIVDMGQ